MAGIENRTAKELKAELTAAIQQSRAMLAQTRAAIDDDAEAFDSGSGTGAGTGASRDDVDFDLDSVDFSEFSDEELDILLAETTPGEEIGQVDESAGDLAGLEMRESEPTLARQVLDDLQRQIARNPVPWAIGAAVVGSLGAQWLAGAGNGSKNPRQNASQTPDSAITHGSLLGEIMKTGFEMAKPQLLEAAQQWISRFVEKRP